MTSLAAFVVLSLLAAANAAPWPADVPKCARECAIAGSPKLAYAPEKTYSYSYSGHSQIHMKGVEGGISQMEWTSEVDLTWLSPCDMAITFKNPSFGGATGAAEATFLTRYPLVVAVTDGHVQHVCSHPDDDTWSINLKKGVASAFQNSLPSNSSVNSGLNFTETDVVGKCPTKYEVQNQGEMVIVEKEKNHRFCQERFPSQAETPMAWLKAPLPMEESKSKCKQEITKGIYTSITCEDKNILKPSYGSYKYVEAHQVSKLQFQSESSSAPQSISNLRGRLVQRSLRYDHESLKKDPAMVPQLEQVWKQVCEKTKQGVEKDAASLVEKAIHIMRRVPEDAIEQMLQKVKSGQICSEKQKMESLYLDAVAFIQEASAVKLMVQEILSSRTTGGRAALYTAALYFTPRPSLHAVEALKPLFENSQQFPMASLAAASMVNMYCRHNPHCQQEAPVRQIAEIFSRKVQQQCSPSTGEDNMKAALVSLKALGNMGVITSEVSRILVECMEKEGVENNVRVAAAQAFRNSKCECEHTRELTRVAVDPRKDTEIRIASYLAAIKCAKEEDLKKISEKISNEENTQVRGFILSHLLNLQESSAPHKENLRYILSSISVPANFSADIRKYSRNIDMSYYAQSIGVGAGVESNIIYTPESFIPRSINLNLTSAFGATPVNFGEFGARVEGLEPILKSLFGPEGYFKKSSMNQIFTDLSKFAQHKGNGIREQLTNSISERSSIDLSTISKFFSKMYGEQQSKVPRADLFARFSGQEIAYASLSKNLHNLDVDRLVESLVNMAKDALHKMKNMEVNTARTAQIAGDYSLPTIQGIPLKLKMEGTSVLGIKMESKLNSLESSSPSIMKMIPSISVQANGFVGFDTFLAKCGLRTKNLISSNNGVSMNVKGGRGFEIEMNLPEKMEILNFKSETYLMKEVKGQPETKINPQGIRESRVQHQKCFRGLEEKSGLKVCYDINLPDIFKSEGLPLGPPAIAKLTIEKSEPSMKGYLLKGDIQNSPNKKEIKVQIETPGSSTPRKAEAIILYSNEQDSYKISAAMSSQASGGVKAELKTKYSDSEKELVLNAYSSHSQQFSPETQVAEVKLSTRYNGQESQVQILTQTKNSLKSYMDHYFEVHGDLGYNHMTGLPYPRRLHKFEFRHIAGDSKVVSSVQKRSESEYISVVKIGSRSNDKFNAEATHNLEGNMDQGMTIKTVATAKMGSEQYKSAFDVYYTNERIGTSLQVVRPGENAKIIDCEAIVERSGQSHKSKIQIGVPALMKTIKFDSNIQDQGSSRYQLQAALKHGSQVILQVDGPVTAKWYDDMKELQTDLRVSTSAATPHRISSAFIMGRNKQVLSFEMKNQQESLFAIEWNMSAENEEQTKAAFKFFLPSVMDNKVAAVISRKHIQVNFNNVVSPKSSSPRRVKGFANVDFENKKANADLLWDADRDSNNKISVEANFVSSSSAPQQTIIHGGWTYIGSTYRYKTEISRSNPDSWLSGRKDFKFELSTPSQKTYAFETITDVEQQSSSAKVTADMKYKNPENKEYKVNSNMFMKGLGWPSSFEFNVKTDIISPEGQQTSLSLETKHEKTSSQRQAYIKMQVGTPSLDRPLKTSLIMMNQENSYGVEWMIDVDSPADGCQCELKLSPEGGIQNLKIGFNMKQIVALLKAAEKVVGMRSVSAGGSQRPGISYLFHYEKPNHTSHKMLIKSPSRTMEGEVKYSPSEYSVKFYPQRKRRSDSKYELSVTHSKSSSPWEQHLKYEGRFSHPRMEREKTVELMYSKNEEKIQGIVTLDIFPRPEDKITGSLESTKISSDSVKVEAKLSGKVLKVNPKVTLTAAYGSHASGFDMLFEKTPSSRPSLIISGKYDRSSGRNAAVAFIVKTEQGPMVEISGSVKPEERPECNGLKVTAMARSSIIGSYDIFSELCKPGFAKISTKKHGSDKAYITRVGLQALKNLELSISEKDEKTQNQRHVAMARVKLVSPTIVNVEMKYEPHDASSIWHAVSEKYSMVSSSAKSWMDNLFREVVREGSAMTPSAQMATFWQVAKEEGKKIYEDLIRDKIIPSNEAFEHLARSKFVNNCVTGYHTLWAQVEHLQKQIYSNIPSIVSALKNRFEGATQFLHGAVIGSVRWLRTGDVPEEMKNLIGQVQDFAPWTVTKRIMDSMFIQYPEEYENFKQIVSKVKDTLAEDFDRARMNFVKLTDKDILWIWSHIHLGAPVFVKFGDLINKAIQESLLSSIQIKGNHIEVQIPLRQPVNTLGQAAQYMSVNPIPVPDNVLRLYESLTLRSADNWAWSYYSLLPRRVSDLLPPYNRTAMIIDGSEILTFDGTVLRAPRSPCKVLLAAYETDSVTMKHPQPSSSSLELTLKLSGVTIVIKPDFTITVNGKEATGSKTIEGDVTIFKTPEEIKIISPIMTIKVYPRIFAVSMEVSGWTFGRVKGLLGTYDNEIANDWATSQGSKASSLQELVRSWQEDQQCQTPSVSLVSAAQVPALKSLQCHALLAVRSRCSPVVRPEPFMKMCYASRNACDVGRAYHAICSSKGVKDIFPLAC